MNTLRIKTDYYLDPRNNSHIINDMCDYIISECKNRSDNGFCDHVITDLYKNLPRLFNYNAEIDSDVKRLQQLRYELLEERLMAMGIDIRIRIKIAIIEIHVNW